MAVSLLEREVSDLCLGKPALRSLSISATVGHALSVLKRFGDNYISVWNCDHRHLPDADKTDAGFEECRCVGKVCMVDIICFLCKEENLSNPGTALQAPVSVLIPKVPGLIRHLEPNARKKLLQITLSNSTLHNNREYCWLTQEDIIRYLLNSIGLFSPTPVNPINSLNIIDTQNILAVHYDDPASLALPFIAQSLEMQTSVAIVDTDGKLIGEISPFTLNSCGEDVAAAIATLSAGDLMAYIDCGGRPEDLIQLVKERLQERNLEQALELMEEDSGITSGASFSSSYSSSSDEEFGVGRGGRLGGYSARLVRRSEAIVCYPWSSLVAVMIQALAHRVSYVWVVEDDGTLAGIVTFAGMMKVFRERLRSMA
ncbi:CBS domain - like 10 [Theobroma cacao]|nr:CBS domain - like 10 [Theobroma cacao]